MFRTTALAVIFLIDTVACSAGDNSQYQRRCINRCVEENCSSDDLILRFKEFQPWYEFFWSCKDECKYDCMWLTVDYFTDSGYTAPQFHGKWPFLRLFGIQEPASTLFSIMNLAGHLIMYHSLYSTIPSSAPMFNVWTFNSLVSMNAWVWSTVFHARDTHFTEMMDYFCAFSLIVASSISLMFRVFGPDLNIKTVSGMAVSLGVFVRHVYYMAFVHFDYGYNMKVNITMGIIQLLGWCSWCLKYWTTKRHVHNCLWTMLILNGAICLELMDFVPIWWMIDAHSLFHLATVPVPFLFYKFVVKDMEDMMKERDEQKNKLV